MIGQPKLAARVASEHDRYLLDRVLTDVCNPYIRTDAIVEEVERKPPWIAKTRPVHLGRSVATIGCMDSTQGCRIVLWPRARHGDAKHRTKQRVGVLTVTELVIGGRPRRPCQSTGYPRGPKAIMPPLWFLAGWSTPRTSSPDSASKTPLLTLNCADDGASTIACQRSSRTQDDSARNRDGTRDQEDPAHPSKSTESRMSSATACSPLHRPHPRERFVPAVPRQSRCRPRDQRQAGPGWSNPESTSGEGDQKLRQRNGVWAYPGRRHGCLGI